MSLTMLIIYSNSFTTATVNNEATFSIISEESALIAINYTESNNFQVSNNTNENIVVQAIELVSDPKRIIFDANFPFSLPPGNNQELTIANNKKDLSGKVLTVSVHWKEGAASIKSTIPTLEKEVIKPQPIEEVIEPEVNEEEIKPTLDSELEEDDEN